ncbi:MAG: translation initiation factor IF-2, partial [Flavobacteriales bacterium]
MAEVKGPQRLGKAAVALGVSKDTIVEFLTKKGVNVDNNPMAKIEADAYDMLLAEFATDQAAKEKNAATAAKIKESRTAISIEDNKKGKGPEKKEEEPEIDYSKFKRKIEVKEKPVVAPQMAKTKETPQEVPPQEEKIGDVKVVGKIDLASIEKPSKGRKKKSEEAPADTPADTPKAKATRGKKAVAPVVETPAPEPAPEIALEPEKELIRVKVEKLSGIKQVGKIELPAEPEKKKEEPKVSEAEKRKRKRVSKVDIGRQQEIDRRNQRTAKPFEPKKTELTEAEIQNQVRATLARLGGHGKSKSSKLRREKRDFVAQRSAEEAIRQEAESTILKLTEFVTVSELATMMNRQPTEIIKTCMQLGIFASLNQRLDAETIHIISEEFGFQVQFVSAEVSEAITEEVDNPEDLTTRPPVVTVMGHVDHGKTSLLDFIRNANVIAGEAGGITQHIGAYNVEVSGGRKITFLDTPGHEAFTAMRARGAKVTDLAIIVIAADDSVMPQTKEAISHAQAANVPMIFAFNKIDKPGANSDKIREQLSAMNILVEEWGGKFQTQEISAKKGLNIDALLEKVLLEADILDLKANPDRRAVGTVIESALDKGRGYVTTLLVESGTLRVGDAILAGHYSGKVKAMFNERGGKINEAGPAMPVSLLGFEGAPNAGDKFHVMEDEREARNIALKRQ